MYLITIVRVLAATTADGRSYKDLQNVDRKTIAEAVLDAFDHPLLRGSGTAGGRPPQSRTDENIVALIVVYRETHADGTAL